MQQQIQEFIENTRTNPYWGTDPQNTKLPHAWEAHGPHYIITSRYNHPDDKENLYYNLKFSDVNMEYRTMPGELILREKIGVLKVTKSGEMTILNEKLGTTMLPLPLRIGGGIWDRIIVTVENFPPARDFTDAKLEFKDGTLQYKDGWIVSEELDAERSRNRTCIIS